MTDHLISRVCLRFSGVIAVLVTITSLLGISNPKTYAQESPNWAMQAVGQDIGNLLAVVVFVGSIYFLRNTSTNALFVWLGCLLYFSYAYLIYAFSLHFSALFFLYVSVLGLSFYTLLGGIVHQNVSRFGNVVSDRRHVKPAATILFATGVLFALLWLAEIVPAAVAGTVPKSTSEAGLWVNPVHVIDLAFVLPGMMLTACLVVRKQALGYLFTAPLLVFSVLMGSSIVATMIQELTTGNTSALPPLIMVGVLVVASGIGCSLFLE